MKTFFEELSEKAEYWMQVEQSIRLCVAQKAAWEEFRSLTPTADRKIAILNRLERILRNHLINYKLTIYGSK